MTARSTRRTLVAAPVLVGGLLAVLAGVPGTGPTAVAHAATAPECSAPLDARTRRVYRFTAGGKRLGSARIEVRAQRRDGNTHCLVVRAGRGASVRWTGDFLSLRDGRCRGRERSTNAPFVADGTIRTGFRVPSGRCVRWTYEIQHDGRWYAASVLRAHR